MQLTFYLEIADGYIWQIHTPNVFTRQLPFYINEAGYFECGKNYFTRRSGQKDFFIVQTVGGSGEMIYQNTTYILEKDSIIFIDCNNYHHYRTLTAPWKIKWIHINGISARMYYDNIAANTNCFTLNHSSFFDDNLTLLIKMDTEQNQLNSFKAVDLIASLLTDLFQISYEEKQGVPTNHMAEINMVLDHIKNHYHEQLRLDDLSSIAHLSKYYFLSLFKSITGSTPCEYIINYRIGQAKKYLRTTELSLVEICENVGFTNESYFVKIFKRLNGITPNNYRRNMVIAAVPVSPLRRQHKNTIHLKER